LTLGTQFIVRETVAVETRAASATVRISMRSGFRDCPRFVLLTFSAISN
jgi:hypothetical protein